MSVDLEPEFARALAEIGLTYRIDYADLNQLDRGLWIRAFDLADSSLALSDNALAECVYTLVFAGEPQEAAASMKKAIRLSPNFPVWHHRPAGIAHTLLGNKSSAVREFRASCESEWLKKESIPWPSTAYAQSGDIPLSREIIKEISQARAHRFVIHQQWFANRYVFVRDQDRERFVKELRKAGLPRALGDCG